MNETAGLREPESDRDSDRDAHYFKSGTVSKIVEAAGGLGATGDAHALQNELETAARSFDLLQVWKSFPEDRLSDLSKLEFATQRLVKVITGREDALAVDDLDGLPDHVISALATSYHGEGLNVAVTEHGLVLVMARQLIEAAVWFRDRAKSARHLLENPPDHFPGHEYPVGSSPEAWFICKALPEIYEQHFRSFRVSRTGPGVRFVQHCLAALEINKKPDAIKRMLVRYRPKGDIGTN